jgi:hypothetical protein
LANAGTASTLSLYLTRDGARSWSPLDSPVAEATGCRFVVDVSQPQYALLLINASASGSCGAPQVFASDAWGASWHIVTLPHPLNTACAPGFFLANGHLYAWSQDSRYVNGGPPGSPLMVSAVGGATWSNAFATLSAAALPLILGAHVDGSLLVQVDVQGSAGTGPPVAPALWCRDGSTGRWSLLANAPETSQAVVVSADPAAGAGCAWAPIYAFSYFVDPGTGQASVTSIAVRHGTAWDGLPSLPVTGASGQQPLGDVGRVLGVGPAGTLLVDVPDASTTSDVSTPQRTIWGWDLGSGRWLRDYSDEPGIARVEGFSWVHTAAGPTAVLWVFGISLGLPPITGVFYATLAANPLAPAGNGSG